MYKSTKYSNAFYYLTERWKHVYLTIFLDNMKLFAAQSHIIQQHLKNYMKSHKYIDLK